MKEVIRKKYRLKLKNFWRQNRKLIVLIGLAAILGVIIAGLNTLYFNQVQDKFTLDEPQVIDNENEATFDFQLENPELASETTIKLEIQNIESTSDIYVSVNGEELQEISQTKVIINVPTELLQNENNVRIYKKSIGFSEQELVAANVTSNTSLQQLMFVILNFTSLLLIFTPLGYVKYQSYIRRKKIKDQFPEFLRDVVQGTRAGMSLPQAIENTESSSYGALDEEIENMSAQIEWGIPFDEVLENFGDEIKSPLIRRSVDTIIQAYNSGGNIQDVLESVGENIRSIKQLREERQSQLYGEMITGYIVYFIFIGILIALTTFLLPNLANASESLGGGLNIIGEGGGNLQENISLYETWFSRLVFIQALFSGIIIGKLSEGELKAGLKHSAILFAIGYLAITFFL